MAQPLVRHLGARSVLRLQHQQHIILSKSLARHASRYSAIGKDQNVFDSAVKRPELEPAAGSFEDPYSNQTPKMKAAKEYNRSMFRIRLYSVGLFLCTLGLGWEVFGKVNDAEKEEQARQESRERRTQLDSGVAGNRVTEKYQGRPVHVIGAGEDKRIVAEGDVETDLVSTGTSSVPFFPKTIYLPSSDPSSTTVAAAVAATSQPNSALNPGNIANSEEYTLLGLGIRTVSFLSIEVYVLGLYVRTTDLSALQARLIHSINETASTLVPDEAASLRAAMLDPARSTELWTALLASDGIKSAWRVSPTKNTDFAHLRDGWVTAVRRGTEAAALLAKRDAAVAGPGAAAAAAVGTEYDSDAFGEAVKGFKDVFAGQGRTAKGSVVTLVRDGKGALGVWFEDPGSKAEETRSLTKIGTVVDERITRLIWLGYLAGKNVSSEPARRGVVDGCVTLACRPVGSAETMVA